jgi:hypothetical protein
MLMNNFTDGRRQFIGPWSCVKNTDLNQLKVT